MNKVINVNRKLHAAILWMVLAITSFIGLKMGSDYRRFLRIYKL